VENDNTIKDGILKEIEVNAGDSFIISSPENEAILFFPPGITLDTVYEIEAGGEYVIETTKERLKGYKEEGEDITYTFAAMVNYHKVYPDPDEAEYVHSNSVCKIRITY